MSEKVLIITGTPAVGKTTIAHELATKLDAKYINLTELAIRENLIEEKDKQRDTFIINESLMKKKICEIINESDLENVIIDGHYAANIVPPSLVNRAFVIRRNPVELRKLLEQKGFSKDKLEENLASEILDVCLVDALNALGKDKVCEIDVTGMSQKRAVNEILLILNGRRKCQIGIVDWLGRLESQGLLDKFLRV